MHARHAGLAAILPLSLAVLVAAASGGCSGGDDKPKGPPAPSMVTASSGDGYAVVSWADVAEADRYIVYIAREPGITKKGYDELDGGYRFTGDVTSPFQVDGLENGQTYFFVVTSVDEDNYEGPVSNEVSTSPSPWGPPQILESLPGEAIGLVAAADGNGVVHAIWARNVGPARQAIHASLYDPDAGMWTAPVALDSSYAISGSPSLSVRPGGDALVAWRQGTGPNDDIWGAWFEPVNGWDAPFLLTDSASGAARNPAVAVTADDGVALWAGNYVSSTAGTLTGIFSAVADGGAAFGSPERRDAIDVQTDTPRVAGGTGGPVNAIWIQDGEIWNAEWDGASWSASAVISTTSDEAVLARLASNADADMVALFVEQNLSKDLYAIRYDAVGGWSAPEAVEQTAIDTLDAAVAVCPGGEAVAVFTQMAGLHARLMGTRWNAAEGWSTPAVVYELPDGDAEAPAIAVDPDCNAHAVWIQEVVDLGGPGTTRNVYSAFLSFESAPDEWSNPLLVSRYGLNSVPTIVVSSGGNVTALWEYYGAGGEEIWFNRLGD